MTTRAARQPALVLSRTDVCALMTRTDYLNAVEAAFRAFADGAAHLPSPMHLPGVDGGFHAKGATFTGARDYAALKLNGNFPGNPERTGLPTIQGVLLLADARNGAVLAIMDSIEVTLRRTAAASALAARHLARNDAAVITVCGCGEQGRVQLEALVEVLPLTAARAWDIDPDKAREFARVMSARTGLPVRAVDDLAQATLQSDVIVTCTSARSPFLTAGLVRPGTFVAAIGADSPDKSELAPELLARATVVVDTLAQCTAMGDLHHALAAGAMMPKDVFADLGEIVTARKPGRTGTDEITIFDSTGIAVQDAACAAWIYERARGNGAGIAMMFDHETVQ